MTRNRIATLIALTAVIFISGYQAAYAYGYFSSLPQTEVFVPMSEVAKGLSFKGTLP